MAKITVYLPEPLAERLDGTNLNVSAVCQQALKVELDRAQALQALRTDDRLAAARARLAETSGETEEEEYEKGKEDGREWAIEEATHKELRVLQRWAAGGSWPGPRFPELSGDLFPTIEGWIDHYNERYDREILDEYAFFHGFADGAVEASRAIDQG
jgi:post-segregation antitoxin (ccd killing protein)